MNQFTLYDKTSGEIISICTTHNTIDELRANGNMVIAGNFPQDTHYVDTATLAAVLKPAQPDKYHAWSSATKTWILPATALSTAQAEHAAALNSTCQATIYAGCLSSALGAPHTYPTKDRDQANLIASVTDSLYPGLPAGWTTPFWCMDSAGAWSLAPHTPAQIQQAGADVKAFILAQITRNAARQASIAAATSIAQVLAIIW